MKILRNTNQRLFSVTSVILGALIFISGMSCYELIKYLLFPNISILQSNITTVLFTTFCGIVAMIIVFHKYDYLNNQLIDHLKQREEAEKHFHTLVEAMQEGLIAVDGDANIQYANSIICQLLGFPSHELTKLKLTDLIEEGSRDHLLKELEKRARGVSSRYEISFRSKDGKNVDFLVSGSPRFDKDGRSCGSFGVFTDITERKKAEAKVAVFSHAVSNATDGIIITDLHAKVTYANSSAKRILGYEAEEIVGLHVSRFIHDPDKTSEVVNVVLNGTKWEGEVAGVRQNGDKFHAAVSASLIVGDLGQPFGMMGVFRDISEQKQAGYELRRAKEEWENTFNAVPYLISVLDKNHKIVRVNSAMAERLGRPSGECIGLFCYETVHGMGHPPAFCPHAALLRDEKPHTAEIFEPGLGGTFIVSTSPIYDSHGQLAGSVHVAHDITERKRMEDSLRESEERFCQLANNVREVFWIAEAKISKVIYISPAYEEIWGRTCAGLYNDPRSWIEAIHPDDRQKVLDTLAGRGNEGHTAEYRIIRPDGTLRWIRDRGFPVSDKSGEVYRFAGICEDVTLRKQMEIELKRAKEKAESASRTKSEFLANMSHEIRTPIGGIMGMADMALSLEPNEDQKECLILIKTAAENLLEIVNDILDISKIEAGKMEMVPENFDLNVLLSTTVMNLRSVAEKKGIDIRYSIAPAVPQFLTGDQAKVRQVLFNLLGNAVKFTEKGRVDINIEKVGPGAEEIAEPDKEIALLFSVGDTGIGISPDKYDSIFEAFEQVDGSVSKKYGGTGLGLAICKHLVTLMGGRIWLESKKGVGTTFYFTVTFKPADMAVAAEPSGLSPQAPPGSRSLMILLAEDNEVNQKFLKHWIEKAGHSVTVVGNGMEVLDVMEKTRFDLILMDIQMPGMDGIEATKMIRSSASRGIDPNIPIIALTAYAMKSDRERILNSGFNAYIAKPVDKNKLFNVVDSMIEERSLSEIRKIVAEDISSDDIDIDLEALKADYDFDYELLADTVNGLKSHLPSEMEALGHALELNDFATATKISHKLKGSIGLFRAPKCLRYTERLEAATRNKDIDLSRTLFEELNKALDSALAVLTRELAGTFGEGT